MDPVCPAAGFATRQEAQDFLSAFTKDLGFALVIKKSDNTKRKVDMRCVRGGEYRSRRSNRADIQQ